MPSVNNGKKGKPNSQGDNFKVLSIGPVEMLLLDLGWKSGESKTEMK